MKIIANDGTEGFDTVDTCLLYEKKLGEEKRKQEEKEKLLSNKRNLEEEIKLIVDTLNTKVFEYTKRTNCFISYNLDKEFKLITKFEDNSNTYVRNTYTRNLLAELLARM